MSREKNDTSGASTDDDDSESSNFLLEKSSVDGALMAHSGGSTSPSDSREQMSPDQKWRIDPPDKSTPSDIQNQPSTSLESPKHQASASREPALANSTQPGRFASDDLFKRLPPCLEQTRPTASGPDGATVEFLKRLPPLFDRNRPAFDATSGEIIKRKISSSVTLPTHPYNVEPIARQIQSYASGLHKRRLVMKTGECNVTSCNVTKRKQKYLVDIFTTLVDMKWRYHLVLFTAAFAISWSFFGLIWFLIALIHRDTIHAADETWHACVDNVHDFPTALLFSIETQTTIGYGYRAVQSECGFAILLLMLQSCAGLFIQMLITGIIFAKISRPKGRSQTIMFSQKAVICKRDGQYNLLFRVGDMRKSHIIGTSIRAILVKNRLTSEGESIPLCQYPLAIETETSHIDSFVFLIWPVTVVHRIDETSPLWDLSLQKLMSEHFEIIVLLEGTIESTGMATQVRTSYVPMEIMWGERLVPLLTFQLQNGRYEIDYSQFHNTTPMVMSEWSAKEYALRQKMGTLNQTEQQDCDDLGSFTAPTIRPASTPSRSLLNMLLRRKLETGLKDGKDKLHGSMTLPTNKRTSPEESKQ